MKVAVTTARLEQHLGQQIFAALRGIYVGKLTSTHPHSREHVNWMHQVLAVHRQVTAAEQVLHRSLQGRFTAGHKKPVKVSVICQVEPAFYCQQLQLQQSVLSAYDLRDSCHHLFSHWGAMRTGA